MDEFELKKGVLNVKILGNIYIKNLRFLSYDPEQAIENLKKVLILSEFLCGPEIKFKHSQINFEIGKALSASLSKRKEGRQYIEKGRSVIEQIYGEDHATMSKYYAFISLQDSIEDKTSILQIQRPRTFAFIKRINAQTDKP